MILPRYDWVYLAARGVAQLCLSKCLVMISHDSDVPVYVQLAGILRDMITSGQVRPHERLPSISYLVQTYGVADQTVKKATQVLRDEGLVQTVTGKGVYVVERP